MEQLDEIEYKKKLAEKCEGLSSWKIAYLMSTGRIPHAKLTENQKARLPNDATIRKVGLIVGYIDGKEEYKAYGTEEEIEQGRYGSKSIQSLYKQSQLREAIETAEKIEIKEETEEEQKALENIYFHSSWDMKEQETESVPLIVTSPPYFAKKEYETKDFEEYKDNLTAIFLECHRILSKGGRICINIGDIPNLNKQGIFLIGCLLNEIFNQFEDIKLIDKIIWKKDDPWMSNPHVKHNEQQGNYRILPSTEYIFIFRKEGKREIPVLVREKSGISKDEWRGAKESAYVSGLWDIHSVKINKDSKFKGHPAMYPEELVKRLIRMYSFVGDKVLDPCLGSGTTVKVAREERRIGIGYEMDEEYKPVILEKLAEKEETKNDKTKTVT